MGLSRLCKQLRQDVLGARYRALFESACEREPILAVHVNVHRVLEALDSMDCSSYESRSQLVGALVRECHRGSARFWASVLLAAFAPMLLHLRASVGDAHIARCDIDQLIMQGFLSAIAAERARANPLYLLRSIRCRTYRVVFRHLATERRWIRLRRELNHYASGWSDHDAYVRSRSANHPTCELEGLTTLLLSFAGRTLSVDRLETIAATCLWQVPLRNYLDRRADGAPVTGSELQRARREHNRALLVLRPLIESRIAGTGRREIQLEQSLDRTG
jgi:hypothetical protein